MPADLVDESTTLNWEWNLAPLMFCYNTLYHKTIKTSPYELTYRMKPRLPSLPIPELIRISYSEGFVPERFPQLKKSCQTEWKQVNQVEEDKMQRHNFTILKKNKWLKLKTNCFF
jgi:hypothetical protein